MDEPNIVPFNNKVNELILELKYLLFPQILVAIFISLPLASPEASPAALASPDAYASDYGYTYNALPVVEAAPSSQYHAQDDVGQYNYGFSSQDQVRVHLANRLLNYAK